MLFTTVLSEYLLEQGGLRSRAVQTVALDKSHLVNCHTALAAHLGVEYDALTIEQITRRNLVSVLSQYGTTKKPNTVNSRITVLRRFYRWCVNEEYLSVSPAATIQGPRKVQANPNPWTKQEVGLLLQQAQRTQQPLRDRAMILFLVLTGCRNAEAISSDIRNLVYEGAELKGIRVKGAKNGRMRFLAFAPEYVPVFEEYLRWRSGKVRNSSCTAVWINTRSSSPRVTSDALSRRGMMQTVARIIELSGVEKKGRLVHSFRHTFASEALRERSHSPRELMEALGHSDLSSIHIYTEITGADLSAAAAAHPFRDLIA